MYTLEPRSQSDWERKRDYMQARADARRDAERHSMVPTWPDVVGAAFLIVLAFLMCAAAGALFA